MGWMERFKLRVGDSNVRVLRGIVLVFCFMVLGRVAGLAKEMAIAHRYGIGGTVDIYVFVFVIISWIPVVFQSIGQSVLVPLFGKLDAQKRQLFFSELLVVTFALGAVLCLVLVHSAHHLINFLAPGFSTEMQSLAVGFTRTIAPAAILLLMITVLSSELLSRERHSNTLAEVVPAIVLFIFVVIWPQDRPSLEPFAIGILVGLGLHLLVLLYISRPRLPRGMFSKKSRNSAWSDMRSSMSILALGALVLGVAKPVDQIMAARLGEGAVSQLSFAVRILALGIGLGTTMVTRALLPVLSDKANSVASRFVIARQWTALMLVASSMGIVLAWWFTPAFVAVIFERGAFTGDDTLAVAGIVRFGLLQVPFILSGMVIVQLFASMQEYRVIAVSGAVGAAIKMMAIIPMVTFFGIQGIVLSSTLMYAGTFGYLIFRYKKRRILNDQAIGSSSSSGR